MIEQINNVPDNLLDGFDIDPIKPAQEAEQKAGEAQANLDGFKGISTNTSDSFADEISKELLGEKEEEEKDEEDEEGKDKEEEKKEEDKQEEEEDENDSEDKSYSFKGLASYLSEEGVIDFEDSEELEDTPEILINSVKQEISRGIDEYKESVPELGKSFLDYLEKGGDPSKFFQALERPVDLENIDLSEEDNQEVVVREYLKQLNYDQKEIDEQVEAYKDGLLLEKQANIASKKLEKIYEKQVENTIKEQEEIVIQQQKKAQEYIENIQDTIQKSKSLAGLEVPEKEKKDFQEYLLKVNPKTGLTRYQEDLQKDYVKNSVELAYLKFKNYDFSKAERQGQTKAAKDIKDKIFKKNETNARGKSREEASKVDFSAFSIFKNNKK